MRAQTLAGIVSVGTLLLGSGEVVMSQTSQPGLLTRLAREDVLIAGPHMNFPALGRLRKERSEYSWAPVVFTDQWDKQARSPQK